MNTWRNQALIVFLSVNVAGMAFAQQMEALDDSGLAEIVGREGIAVDIAMHINTDANGAPLSDLGNCKNTNLCNIAIQLNNRTSGGGEWLVLKDASASMRLKNLHIDAAFTASAPSPYADSSRFQNAAGTVCLPNGQVYAAATCAGSVLDKPTVQFSYPGAYSAFESDFELYLNIGRMAVQYGSTGYSADQNGSFMGVLISDTAQRHAKIDFDGRVFLSGF